MTHIPPPENVITFAEGLPGFETCRRYVLISSLEAHPFSVVQSADGDGPSFVVVDPRLVVGEYPAVLDAANAARLGADGRKPLLWLAIIAVRSDGTATANLRAPLVVDPVTMRGIQMMSADSTYLIEHPLQAA